MVRVRFKGYKQAEFLKEILEHSALSSEKAARLCNVCGRTFRDWKRGKYQMSYDALSNLCKVSNMPIPKDIEKLPEFWSVKKASRMGGRRYFELYGVPGTIESRRKGGINSSKKFLLNPEWAKERGFVVRKEIKCPYKSPLLAEFIGMMIGDGGIRNRYQITISYNLKQDKAYADHIQRVVRKLFGISCARYIREKLGAADIVVTGSNLIEFLEKLGIKKGNKVINQIDVPAWIFKRRQYQIACLRGLFDTDGCVYLHTYSVAGKRYGYTKMCFSNSSLPVLVSIKKMLKNLNFNPIIDRRQQAVYLNRSCEVKRYFLDIGSSNPRYLERYNRFVVTPINTIG